MAIKSEDLRREAMDLPEGERAELAAELLVSLEPNAVDDDTDVSSLWSTEIERRARHVIEGASSTESWATVRQRLADSLGR